MIVDDILTHDINWRNSIYKEIFEDSEYVYDNIFIEEDDIVVDFGANIGIFTLYALSKSAKFIYAFEPIPEYVDLFKKNLENYTNVKLYEAGISYKNEKSEILYNFDGNTMLSDVYKEFNWKIENNKKIDIDLISINDFLKNLDVVNFLKIDIEGSEYDVFENISDDNLKKINKIAGEYHWNYDNRLKKIITKLEKNNFKVSIIITSDEYKIGKFFAIKNNNNLKMQELIAIPGYPIDEQRETLMLSTIKQLKKLNKPILVLAHCPISEKIQNEVDYVIYDSNNTLIDFNTTDSAGYFINNNKYNYPTVRFTYGSPFIDVEIANPISRHNIVCLTNLQNALNFAKENKFEWLYFIENDNDIADEDLYKFNQIKDVLIETNKSACFQFYTENEIASEMYITKVDFMLDNIKFSDDVHNYFKNVKTIGSNSDLESYLYHSFKDKFDQIMFDKLEKLGDFGKAHEEKISTQVATSQIFNKSKFNTQNDTHIFEARACSVVKSLDSDNFYLILINEQLDTQQYRSRVYVDDVLKYDYTFKIRPFFSYIKKCNKKPAKYRFLVENLTRNNTIYDEEIFNFNNISSTVRVKQEIPLWDVESSYEPYNLGANLRNVVRENRPKSIIEFGVLNGYSSINMALEIKSLNLKTKIKAYDLWDKYPYKKTNPEYTKYNLERYEVEHIVELKQIDFYDWCKNPEKADLYHIDISNNGDIIELAVETLKPFILEGSILLFEGGSEERDDVEWMTKYNKRPIRNIETEYKILNNDFPSLSMIDKECLDI